MGNQPGANGQGGGAQDRVAAQVGKAALSGRYHRLPRKLEDDYDICEKVLGKGYNGVVKMATAKGASSKCAVKALRLDGLSREKKLQLESEVDIFLAADHPHVARLFDVYETPKQMHLVMECLEGGELFDRVSERKTFPEGDAAEAVSQMLLSVNYLHKHGVAHRDLKLENFLYESRASDHLKLIDFGFSKAWDPNLKMQVSCGTLAYVAPEVLAKSYTSQCDLWSMGVITFILLGGYMPFSGSQAVQTQKISRGQYVLKPERWNRVSQEAKEFVSALLQVSPQKRLTAAQALEHSWIANRRKPGPEVDAGIVDALRDFGKTTKFRRACMDMLAWSLSNEDRAKVRQYFVAMDRSGQGTITLADLKEVLTSNFNISDAETQNIFAALDSNQDDTIHYSDFLAAMLSKRIALHSDMLRRAFKRFDKDNSGYITAENLRQVLGSNFMGEEAEALIKEADALKDGRISYEEFVAYLSGEPLEAHVEATSKIIDNELAKVGKAISTEGKSTIKAPRPEELHPPSASGDGYSTAATAGGRSGRGVGGEKKGGKCCEIL
mmetsp:Transcript_27821/g.60808  ORF Transcript_27821/g.60808 Transcript_27821/m.60808 type:complete len:553 (+) Transcript_27821:21-1679(+)